MWCEESEELMEESLKNIQVKGLDWNLLLTSLICHKQNKLKSKICFICTCLYIAAILTGRCEKPEGYLYLLIYNWFLNLGSTRPQGMQDALGSDSDYN